MKTGILLNCRLGSTRYPRKHLIMVNGEPLIYHLASRIHHHFPNIQIIINTSCRKENNKFDVMLEHCDYIEVFHGNDENIPYRQLRCAEQFNLSHIISVCADNFLISMDAIKSVQYALLEGDSIVKTTGLPLGMNLAGYSYQALKESLQNVPENSRLETGWYTIFQDKMHEIKLGDYDLFTGPRLTLDYPEDAKLVSEVIRQLPNISEASDQDILDLIQEQNLSELNQFLNERYWKNFHRKTDTLEESVQS